MSPEVPASSASAGNNIPKPESFPGSFELARQFDVQFNEWSSISLSHHPNLMQLRLPMAETLINDCRIITDINAEVIQHTRLGHTDLEKHILRARLERLAPIALQANNTALDKIPVDDGAFAAYFARVQQEVQAGHVSSETTQALQFMRRLFVYRELLVPDINNRKFKAGHMSNVFARLAEDESKLSK